MGPVVLHLHASDGVQPYARSRWSGGTLLDTLMPRQGARGLKDG